MFNKLATLNIWDYEIFGNTASSVAVSLAIFVILITVFNIFRFVLLSKLRNLAEKTKTDIDDVSIKIIENLSPSFYFFISFYFATLTLSVGDVVVNIIEVVLILFIVVQAVNTIHIAIDFIIRKRVSGSGGEDTKGSVEFISGLLKAVLWIIGVMMVFSNFGINITSLIAGLGIGGIAVALALQNILGDLFSSFAIHFDKPFRVGDFIVVGDKKGVIEKIGIKTTRIRALQGEEVIISNRELTSAQIQNFKNMQERRASFSFGIIYETPTEILKKIPEIVKDIIDGIPGTRFNRTHFKQFDDSALSFEVVYYVLSGDYDEYMNIQQEINIKIMEAFKEVGVSMAYPTRTVYMQK